MGSGDDISGSTQICISLYSSTLPLSYESYDYHRHCHCSFWSCVKYPHSQSLMLLLCLFGVRMITLLTPASGLRTWWCALTCEISWMAMQQRGLLLPTPLGICRHSVPRSQYDFVHQEQEIHFNLEEHIQRDITDNITHYPGQSSALRIQKQRLAVRSELWERAALFSFLLLFSWCILHTRLYKLWHNSRITAASLLMDSESCYWRL